MRRLTNPLFITLALFLGLWVFLSFGIGIKKAFLPSPIDTFEQLGKLSLTSDFWWDIWASWLRVFLGFVLSFLIAYPAMLAALVNPKVKAVIFYIVEFFRYLPIPVFIPLTIFWLGLGNGSKVMIVFLGTFAQMIPMFYDSAMLMDNKFDAFTAALKWPRYKYVRRVIIPGSLPHIVDNSRICFGWAWTYLIIAELLGAENGIGYAIIRAQRYLATDKIFAYIIVIGILGVAMDRTIVFFKRRYFRWL